MGADLNKRLSVIEHLHLEVATGMTRIGQAQAELDALNLDDKALNAEAIDISNIIARVNEERHDLLQRVNSLQVTLDELL